MNGKNHSLEIPVSNTIIPGINKILNKKIGIFIRIMAIKISQISTLQIDKKYKIYNENIIVDNKNIIIRKFKQFFNNNNKELYTFIRINIDHCINVSQMILSDINNKQNNKNIYTEQFNSSILFNNIFSFNDKLHIIYILTNLLSETIHGLNNIYLNDYYNLLIWDMKKIIIIYVLNNLKFLFKYYDILNKKYDITYKQLLTIQNNISYDVKLNTNSKL